MLGLDGCVRVLADSPDEPYSQTQLESISLLSPLLDRVSASVTADPTHSCCARCCCGGKRSPPAVSYASSFEDALMPARSVSQCCTGLGPQLGDGGRSQCCFLSRTVRGDRHVDGAAPAAASNQLSEQHRAQVTGVQGDVSGSHCELGSGTCSTQLIAQQHTVPAEQQACMSCDERTSPQRAPQAGQRKEPPNAAAEPVVGLSLHRHATDAAQAAEVPPIQKAAVFPDPALAATQPAFGADAAGREQPPMAVEAQETRARGRASSVFVLANPDAEVDRREDDTAPLSSLNRWPLDPYGCTLSPAACSPWVLSHVLGADLAAG